VFVVMILDGAKRRRLRRSAILDKIITTNNSASKRSRPPLDRERQPVPSRCAIDGG